MAEIELNNDSPLSLEEVKALMKLPNAISILELDLDSIKAAIEHDPKVETARVYRKLPHKIVLDLVPERPIFVGNLGDLAYFNRNGEIISEVPMGGSLRLPLVSFQDKRIDHPVTQRRIKSVIQIIQAMERNPGLNLTDIGDIVVRRAKYRGKAEILMTFLHRAISDSKRKSVQVSFAANHELDQVNRLASIVKKLPRKQIELSKIRLELGKKVIVKIAQ